MDLDSSEGTIVRAAYGSWYRNAGASRTESPADVVYPGFMEAASPAIRAIMDHIFAIDTLGGTFLQAIVARREIGSRTVRLDICADYRDVDNGRDFTAPPSGRTIEIKKRGGIAPPEFAIGSAERPTKSMFGTWLVSDIDSPDRELERCGRWSATLPTTVQEHVGVVSPGWPRS